MNKEGLIAKIEKIDKAITELNDPEKLATPKVDGIVDLDEYLAAPLKILWILKEVNSPNDTEGWDLKNAIKGLKTETGMRKGWGRTFNPIVYATNGIFSGRNWEEIEYIRNNPDLIDDLKKIAYVNVKKIPGGSRVDYKKLHNSYHEHKEILLKQIEVFDPEVIICGSTFQLIKGDLDLKGMDKKVASPVHMYHSKERIIIDAYHPNNRTVKQKLYCDSIIDAVKEWKASK